MHGSTPATVLDGRWRGPPDKMTPEFGEASSHIQHSIALIDGAMQGLQHRDEPYIFQEY